MRRRSLFIVERVFTESMRLFPPVYAAARQAVEDVQICGYMIGRGAMVQAAPCITHRDPHWFDRPLQFNPDCFEGDIEKQLPSCAYFPFGAGPRAWVGKGCSMMEGVLALATI